MVKKEKAVAFGCSVACITAIITVYLYKLRRKKQKTKKKVGFTPERPRFYSAPNFEDLVDLNTERKMSYETLQRNQVNCVPDLGLRLNVDQSPEATFAQQMDSPIPDRASPHILPVFVSAPGQVLLTGGYLVLEQPNSGIVLATSSRFYAGISYKKYDAASQAEAPLLHGTRIVVESPQFHARSVYALTWKEHIDQSGRVEERPVLEQRVGNPNPLVEDCLATTLTFLRSYLHAGALGFFNSVARSHGEREAEDTALCITLQAHNDFYSQASHLHHQGLPHNSFGLKCLPDFLPCPVVDGKVVINKTGLGSSAALTTALVGSLLQFFRAINLEDPGERDCGCCLVHNLAQLCHSHAKGKIWSGFDVSAAVYGSQVYTRFSKDLVETWFKGDQNSQDLVRLVDPESSWDLRREPFQLPKGLKLLMGDVCGGSRPPSMRKKVLQWKRTGGIEASKVWQRLGHTNNQILILFRQLIRYEQQNSQAYAKALETLSTLRASTWGQILLDSETNRTMSCLQKLHAAFTEVRNLLKEIGVRANVPLEPDEQTALADATVILPGVLCAGVPGVGGYDAIYAIILGDEAKERVEKLWASDPDQRHTHTHTQSNIIPPEIDKHHNERGDPVTMENEQLKRRVIPLTLHCEPLDNDNKCLNSENGGICTIHYSQSQDTFLI